MAEFTEFLALGAGIDTRQLFSDAKKIEGRFDDLAEFAGDTFETQIARELAKSIDPNDVKRQAELARKEIANFGEKARKTFEKTLGREQAKRIFDPIRDESKTFFGQLRSGFREAFDIRKIALGTAAGIGLVEIFRGITDVAGQIIAVGRDAEETRSKFNVLFGDTADEVRRWADTFSDAVGRARIDTEDFLSQVRGFLEPMNLAGDAADELSKTLVERSVDVASFFNKFDADVIRDFQSAISGETEPVKKYGVLINATRVQQEAWESGITEAGKALTEQEKVLARVQLLLRDTSSAQGDAIRTSDSLANQQKRLEANFKNLADSMSGAVVPVVNTLFTAFNNVIRVFEESEIEEQIRKMRELGATDEQLNFVTLRKTLKESTEEARTATLRFNEMRNAALEINETFRGIPVSDKELEIQRLLKSVAEVLDTTKGLKDAQQILVDLDRQQLEIRNELSNIELGISRAPEQRELLEEELALIEEKSERLSRLISARIKERDAVQKQKELQEDVNNLLSGEQQGTEDTVDELSEKEQKLREIQRLQSLSNDELNAELKTNKQMADEIRDILDARKEELRIIERANQIIDQIRKETELLQAETGIERRLIQRRQEAEERREQVGEQREAIKAINEFERLQIQKTIDTFRDSLVDVSIEELQKKLKELSDETLVKTVELELEARLELKELKIEPRQLGDTDKLIAEQAAKVRKSLDDFYEGIEEETNEGTNKLGNALQSLDSILGSVLPEIDQNLANIANNILNFGQSLVSGNILGAITGGVGILAQGINAIFGDAESAQERFAREVAENRKRRIEETKRKIQEEEEAARAAAEQTKELARQLRDLDDALRDAGFNELQNQLVATKRQIEDILGSGALDDIDLSLFSPQRRRDLLREFDELTASIIPGEATQEQLQRLGEILAQLAAPKEALDPLLEGLDPEQQRILKSLFDQLGLVFDRINEFGIAADDFGSAIEEMELRLALFDIKDPSAKLKIFEDVLADAFGEDVRAIFDDIPKFVQDAFDALKAGGDDLDTFLEGFGIDDLTRDQLIQLLETLEGFDDELANISDDIKKNADNILADLLSSIDTIFRLTDITDPTDKLEQIITGINEKFDSSIDDIDDFITRGIEAFIDGGDKLEAFLEEFGLEDIGEDAFKNLIIRLEALQDDIKDAADGVSDELRSFGDLFSDLLSDISLEFELFDIDDPRKRLRSLLDSLQNQFGLIIPDIQRFIEQGFNALTGIGDESLQEFLARFGFVGDILPEEFERLLRELDRLQDQLEREGDRLGDEDVGLPDTVGISAVKAITFEQGNKITNELQTIRIVLTQSLDIWRSFKSSDGFNPGGNGNGQDKFFIFDSRNGSFRNTDKTALNDQQKSLADSVDRALRFGGL